MLRQGLGVGTSPTFQRRAEADPQDRPAVDQYGRGYIQSATTPDKSRRASGFR